MAYTDETLVNDALEKLKVINPATPDSFAARLRTMIPTALIQMASRVAQSSLSELLRSTFTETAINGVAPLTTSISASEPLLIDSRVEVFVTGSDHPLEPVPDRETLALEGSEQFGFYCIEGSTILVKAPNSAFGDYDGTVTIIGSRVPLSSTTPLQLQPELLQTLVVSAQGAS